jgi:F0F1-type ATP synthase delta subunit
VIGGLRLQYGDRVVDATVANRLEQLRRRLAAT